MSTSGNNIILNLGSKFTDVAKALEGDWGSQNINGWTVVSLSDKFEIATRPLTAGVTTELPWAVDQTRVCLICGDGNVDSKVIKIGEGAVKSDINGIGFILNI